MKKNTLIIAGLVTVMSQLATNLQAQTVNLSSYVRIGRYDLPEPTRTTPPANSLLAQEVSGVTYNWDTQTLFVIGDGSTSIVQISKTGALINSMTLAQGSSPQGTEFYDTEGLTYIGNGKFVLVEERDRQAVLFTYTAGTTLVRSATQTVKLGTTVGNVGLEGLSFDPMTGGYIFAKEITPLGIFQSGIDFTAGTATNGSPTTTNSATLFDPALSGVTDFADVYALSNIPSLVGQPNYGNLLVLSQESGKIVNIDRSGTISSTLTIVSDPGNQIRWQHHSKNVLCTNNRYIQTGASRLHLSTIQLTSFTYEKQFYFREKNNHHKQYLIQLLRERNGTNYFTNTWLATNCSHLAKGYSLTLNTISYAGY